MKAFWVARSKIIDQINYKKYTDLVPNIIKKYNGKILARGGDYEILEGTKDYHRFVIFEFPSLDSIGFSYKTCTEEQSPGSKTEAALAKSFLPSHRKDQDRVHQYSYYDGELGAHAGER